MATYFLLITLTPEGREASFEDPARLLRIERETEQPGVECLGLYGVLGHYDFISMVEADDNEAIAQFSLEYGVRAGAHVETLPAVPISRFEHQRTTRPRHRRRRGGVTHPRRSRKRRSGRHSRLTGLSPDRPLA